MGLAALLALVVMGCGADDEATIATTTTTTPEEEALPFAEQAADSVLSYRLVDYAFQGPVRAEGRKLFFKAENAGTEDHELEVLDARGEALGEIEAFAPGVGSEPFAVELEPGTYTLQCILETKDGKVHRSLGMLAELVVG